VKRGKWRQLKRSDQGRLDGERRGAVNVIVGKRKVSECESFLSYVFKDACFPPECEDRIKIKIPSSDIKFPSAQIVF